MSLEIVPAPQVRLKAMLMLLLALFVQATTIQVQVRSDGAPVAGAQVVATGVTRVTDGKGIVSFEVVPGAIEITVLKDGYVPVTTSVQAIGGRAQPLVVTLEPQPTHEEEVIVSATRTGKRVEDQPLRVEVVPGEEVQEKIMMTPGDVSMLLNETNGLRVQTTSPVARGRERADPGPARPIHADPRGRVAALRRADRVHRPAADPADGSRTGGSDQRGRVRALRNVGYWRRRQPGDAASARGGARVARSSSTRPAMPAPTSSAGWRRRSVPAGATRSSAAGTSRSDPTSIGTAGRTCRSIVAPSRGRGCSGTTAADGRCS